MSLKVLISALEQILNIIEKIEKSMNQKLDKLIELIEKVKIGMLTTQTEDGQLKSRPMGVSGLEEDGTLWFFNHENSCKTSEIEENPKVNLVMEDHDAKIYLSISANAEVSRDKGMMNKLYSPATKLWFPNGLEDPDVSLLKLTIDSASYWITEENKLKRVYEYSRAYIREERPRIGAHRTFSN